MGPVDSIKDQRETIADAIRLLEADMALIDSTLDSDQSPSWRDVAKFQRATDWAANYHHGRSDA
jgi:hypothetical protein